MDSQSFRILILTKRQYMNKDLIDDSYGRFREIPLELALRGHKIKGLCLSYKNKKKGYFSDGPVIWESLNAGSLKFPGLFRFIRRASQLAQRTDVILASSDSFYGVLACLIGRRFHIPVVFDLYDNFEFYLAARLPVVKQLYRWAIKTCDAVTCISKPLARLIHSYGRRERVYIMENAVRQDLFKPRNRTMCRKELGLPVEAHLIGTAGALHNNRGIKHLFTAFAKLKSRHPDLHLVLAGHREQDVLIPDHPDVHYFGTLNIEVVPKLISTLDVAAICNLENAFGRYCFPQKVREIMACDIPLVAAQVESMKELFHAFPEWLYAPDDPENLARVLEHRLSDRRTAYENVVAWRDLAILLEHIFKTVCHKRLKY